MIIIPIKEIDSFTMIVDIYNSNRPFLIHHLGVDKIDEPFIIDEISEMHDHGFNTDIIIDDNMDVVGLIDYALQDNGCAYLSLIMIKESVQGKGYGFSAFKVFKEMVRSKHMTKIRIDVVDDYPENLVDYWEKIGFSIVKNTTLTWGAKTSSVSVMEMNL